MLGRSQKEKTSLMSETLNVRWWCTTKWEVRRMEDKKSKNEKEKKKKKEK